MISLTLTLDKMKIKIPTSSVLQERGPLSGQERVGVLCAALEG